MTHKLKLNSDVSLIRVYPNGRREWLRDGKVEKAIWADGTEEIYLDGKFYKIVYKDGTEIYYQNGLVHRSGDEPAALYPNGTKEWRTKGKLDRKGDKPARICPQQNIEEYRVDGKLHRGNGPAIDTAEFKQYWLQGIAVPEFLYRRIISRAVEPHDFLVIEKNIEVRKLILEALGGYTGLFQKLQEIGITPTVKEERGEEKLISIPTRDDRNGNLTLVIVKDATTNAIYALRVPPKVTSITEAKAYTFGKPKEEYNPSVET